MNSELIGSVLCSFIVPVHVLEMLTYWEKLTNEAGLLGIRCCIFWLQEGVINY